MSEGGILLVDKPAGMTSAEVVRVLKRRHRFSAIGHLGTLDPMATGLLPLCIDAGTKIAQFLAAEHKAYTGTIRLGIATDTLDVTGAMVLEAPVPSLGAGDLEDLAARLCGEQVQIPPMYSAVKVGGQELYKRARAGEVIERAPRSVVIHALTLGLVAEDLLEFTVRCSKGTYVRVLAEEVGRRLGTVATLASLRRTEFGPFRLSAAVSLDRLLAPGTTPELIAPLAALQEVRRLAVDASTAFAIATGQPTGVQRLAPPGPTERIGAVLAPDGGLLAVVGRDGASWRLLRVLMPEAVQLYRP